MTGDTGIQEHLIGDEGSGATISALSIISVELMETIRNAHLALEDCVDGRGGSAALVRAGELLHQVRGALQITERRGIARRGNGARLQIPRSPACRQGS